VRFVAEPAQAGRAGANVVEFSVSELSAAIRRALEEGFSFVRLRGEISGFRGPHSSGHCYFSLKDDKAKIEAVIWRSSVARLKCKPAEGLEVIATGRITTYPGSSRYQIVIEMLEPAGVGALMALLEERKQKLAAEGLFSEARKRKLPFLPRVVGIITSPTGAVIRDMLHGFDERFPTRVIVWPVRVQGDTCAAEVAAAIKGFNALPPGSTIPRPDVLIVARGGGSLEDLWGFNEEIVARAAAASQIPLISAVGHETDWTLIDLAADARAPTPTKAAEWAVPKYRDLAEQTADLGFRVTKASRRVLEAARKDLRSAARALPSLDKLLSQPRQRFDAAEKRLSRALLGNTQAHARRFAHTAPRLQPRLLMQRIERARDRLDRLSRQAAQTLHRGTAVRRARRERLSGRFSARPIMHRLDRCREKVDSLGSRIRQCFDAGIAQRRRALAGQAQMLASLSYQSVLHRGFALVRDDAGRTVRSACGMIRGQPLDIELADGHVQVEVRSGPASAAAGGLPPAPAADRPAAARSRAEGRKKGTGQGSLFD
jgi:exodeoxyribonuclease VII large subunit